MASKKKVTVDVGYKVKGADKVEDSFDGVSQSAEKASESVDKVGQKTGGLKGAFASAKQGIGGLLQGFKAIITNPVGAVIAGVVLAFQSLKAIFESNEDASNKLGEGFAFLKGLLIPLKKAVLSAFDVIAEAIESPGEAWDSIVKSIESGFNFLKTVVFDPYIAVWSSIILGIEKGILKVRIAWNEWTGDNEEADKLNERLDEVNTKLDENVETLKKAKDTAVDTFNSAVNAVTDLVEESTKYGNVLAELERREQNLIKARRIQEVQNAKSIAQLEELKVIRDDESKSLDERIEANEKIANIEANRVQKSISLTRQELQLLKDRASVEGESTELLDQITEKEIELAEQRNENAGIRAEQTTNAVNLRKEQFDKEASLIDGQLEKNAILEEDNIKLAQSKIDAEQKKLDKLKELGLEENQIFIDQQKALDIAELELEKEKRDNRREQEEEEAEKEKRREQDRLKEQKKFLKEREQAEEEFQQNKAAIINGGFELANTLAKEGSKEAEMIQKASALTQIGIDTAKAFSSLTKNSEANPANAVTGGLAGIAQFAAGAVRIATNIGKAYRIINEPIGDVPSPDTQNDTGANAPSPDVQRDIGFDGESAGSERFGAETKPIRAYVTESDITESQNNINNIKNISQLN